MKNIVRPSTDFGAVRDGRNSPDAYFDFDLANVRDELINVAGNSFYIDADPSDGNAVVYFQETDNLRGPTPFYVSPGFIARIPFTQIRVVNLVPQPGKKIRVIYGVDTDFQPGSVSQTSVTIAGEVSIIDTIADANRHYYFNGASLVSFNIRTILAPASNVNGVVVKAASVNAIAAGAAVTESALVASLIAPVSFASATNRLYLAYTRAGAASTFQASTFNLSRVIPIGWGLYDMDLSVTTQGSVSNQLEYEIL